MDRNSRNPTDAKTREALISLTALCFIEDHRLLTREQLEDARKSLQALFVRTSGEETMLRKLIETLRTTRSIHQSFASIATVLTGVGTCVRTVDGKHGALRERLNRLNVTAEERRAIVGPLLSFAHDFSELIEALHRAMQQYLAVKENESKCASIYEIARQARARLRERLTTRVGAEGPGEAAIKDKVIASFDYAESEFNLKQARRDSQQVEREIRGQLGRIQAMCQLARNPAMREDTAASPFGRPDHPDVFALFATALERYPRLVSFKDAVLDLFRMYQSAYGMFSLDFDNLRRAVDTMLQNPGTYFEAREEARDLDAKREKLRKIEGLIPFLERAAETVPEDVPTTYHAFSRRVSDIISTARAPWEHIFEELLRAKVQAEADLSTRL